VIGLASGQARETIYFTASLSSTNLVPPQIGTSVGYGEFSLSGRTLNYAFTLPPYWPGAQIHGPAGPGTNAPVIIDLGYSSFCTISIPDHTSDQCYLAGSVLLSRSQIVELLAGLWYVNSISLALVHQIFLTLTKCVGKSFRWILTVTECPTFWTVALILPRIQLSGCMDVASANWLRVMGRGESRPIRECGGTCGHTLFFARD